MKDNIIRWIRHYFDMNGRQSKAVIGISGGKDSTIVAALCVEALGKDRVLGVLLPQGKQDDINVAYAVCKHLQIEHIEINIDNAVADIYRECMLAGLQLNSVATSNTPARVRMTTLYAVSAMIGGRVANTCNLSEDWVGYTTKFGDGAGDFSPLRNLTVTEVKTLGDELGLPSRFVDKVPEDGLSGLSDEDNLGFTYDVLDKYIRTWKCEDASVKAKIDTLHDQNLHKLRPIPTFDCHDNL